MLKNFTSEIVNFIERVRDDKPFSISRFGDGELSILEGKAIDLLKKWNGEFKYTPNSTDEKYRTALMESYTYNHENYYVGIACPCCVGTPKFEYMRKLTKLPECQLTWANIFVNSNYKLFMEKMVPLLKNKQVYMVSHNKADVTKLPFQVHKEWKVGVDAWKQNYELIDVLTDEAVKTENTVFIICAGPFANILAYNLNKANPNNFYLDAGSVFDKTMGLGATRRYLAGAETLRKVCIWE